MILPIIIVLFWVRFTPILASEGDRSPMYQKCNIICLKKNCTQDGTLFTKQAEVQQDTWSRLTGWTCRDECRYHCMWRTVQGFKDRVDYIPKFHGKWPFIRLYGVQEPASAFASVLNLFANVYMHMKIRIEFPARTMPLVLFWQLFAVVCMNAWVWSTIFHMRDTDFTEFMDYACALSMVMGLFVAAIVRVLHRKKKLTAAVLLIPLLYYIQHVRYLYIGAIDYDYNMKVNVAFGATGSIIWLVWAITHYYAGQLYMWRMIAFTLLSGAALLLELFDFPPKYNAWDAHALWHLSTAPLPLLFYQFVIDDLRYLQYRNEKMSIKLT